MCIRDSYYIDPSHLSTPGLEPEKTWSGSLNLGGESGSFSWSCRVFRSRTAGMIDWRRDEGAGLWISANLTYGLYSGLDISTAWEKKKIGLRFLYTYQRVSFGESESEGILKYRYYFPDHSLSLVSRVDLNLISFHGTLKFEKDRRSRSIHPFGSLRAVLPAGRASFFMEVLNIFNIRLEKIAGLPEAPRTFGLGISYNY